jgi:hypothetical protein
VNDLPTISDIPDTTINEDTSAGPLAFTVGDVETSAANLTLSGSSSNTTLVPNGNISFGGSGANRTVTVTPVPNGNGTATITITVTDADGGSASDSLVLTVTPVPDPIGDIRVTAGINTNGGALPRVANHLEITQDDTVSFEAVPAPGAQFEELEPVWHVTGMADSVGPTVSVTFGTFRPQGATTVEACTPSTGTCKTVTIDIVPYVTGIQNMRYSSNPPSLRVGFYGTIFAFDLVPSAGATPADLDAFIASQDLHVRENVTWPANPWGFNPGVITEEANDFVAGATVRDHLFSAHVVMPLATVWPAGVPATLSSPQDWLWWSMADDSLRRGVYNNDGIPGVSGTWQNEVRFVGANPVDCTLGWSGQGFAVTTSDAGVSISQIYAGPPLFGGALTLTVTPNPIPVAGTATAQMVGTTLITPADILAGQKTLTLRVWDDDALFDDLLTTWTAVILVPPRSEPGVTTTFVATTTLFNVGGVVWGASTSGEGTAEVFFDILGAPGTSNIVSVTAN